MNVNKTQAVMYILMILLRKGEIRKDEIMSVIDLSDLSFRRYLQEIRAFFINFDLPYELRYSREDDSYKLYNDRDINI